ncbi:MAG TPA: hypothetical protein VL221_01730 [Bacteroidota bacterium]|nr:hypothetical protein [Bacteroidota bacterium]
MTHARECSRRDFLRTLTSASAVAVGAGGRPGEAGRPAREEFPRFRGTGYSAADGPAGLLYSQVGYEAGLPVRVVVRLPRRDLLDAGAMCVLVPDEGGKTRSAPCAYWGELWGSHWWVAEFPPPVAPGSSSVEIRSHGAAVLSDGGLAVGENILWDRTLELSAVDMLERRTPFTKVGAGWQDAGTLWVESCSQSAMIIALADLLEEAPALIGAPLVERIHRQMDVGCRYLVMTQEKARELGFPPGAMSHDLLGHERDILPQDALKAVIALGRAAALLGAPYARQKESYARAAALAWEWLTGAARPMGSYGMSLFQRGLPEGTAIPADEWQTRDLLLFCWAALVMHSAGNPDAKELCIRYAGALIERQIPREKAEGGYYGHFREFASMEHSEKSWTHGIVDNRFGADMGGIYPNYLLPLVSMVRSWPDHAGAARWTRALRDFADGYLIPACEKNPFLIVPQGIFGEEGPVWFCGTFHGTNAIYGFTAALALELDRVLARPALRRIAYGNLLWLAGLNAGLTRQALRAAMVYSADVPEGAALPVSMMCGVGRRWAGTWFQTRGVICNGFHAGKQFTYDVEPTRANDGPSSLTDEDWIPHSAAWLTGLLRLVRRSER